ncbi:hypothetical protein M407DRAFT_23900 [Tulasnella calospora MUT 4182]|uniref:BTB domain-containing protein n=1 Tax=Tulasnella calospora MUT 4182 TaxID=1051891 RepID=A0A0C3Q9T5_9AGAM|nr:hypothetical protein M407DRAFT_23900 [Tulasnella calospora MUT 4182]
MKTAYRQYPLHAQFHNRNLRAFRQILEATRSAPATAPTDGIVLGRTPGSGSGPRSWQNSWGQSSIHAHLATGGAASIINGRDSHGRTILHCVCSSTDPTALQYLQAVLAHPYIDVNLRDLESGWTALHRALWCGNLSAAMMLMSRTDLQLELRDNEGYTAFDLYNSTVEGTTPPLTVHGAGFATAKGRDLFMWGTSRQLPFASSKDGPSRIQPERVELEHPTPPLGPERLRPIKFMDIAMGRLHTVVVTDETSGNVWAMGHGTGGRLGTGASSHLQTSLAQLSHLAGLKVTSVAAGQDHTLVLTADGEVYSWGLGRFHQLGYPVEAAKNPAGQDETAQTTARRVVLPVKSVRIRGVAASKIASACWSHNEVFTFGTNRGQLGYSKVSAPVQILPRQVTPITAAVASAAISDSALCVLFVNGDVVCWVNDTHQKISFNFQPFPPEIKPSYTPSVVANSRYRRVEKIACCEETFAIISESGDVHSWNISAQESGGASHQTRTVMKPQRVWTASRQLMAAKDVALGSEGSLIICTEAGHAFVRVKSTQPATTQQASVSTYKPFKWSRVPIVHRAVKVATSPTGSFAVMTSDAEMQEIGLDGRNLTDDVSGLLGFTRLVEDSTKIVTPEALRDDASTTVVGEDWGEDLPSSVEGDVNAIRRMCDILSGEWTEGHTTQLYARPALDPIRREFAMSNRGGDLLVCTRGFSFLVHAAVLAARSDPMRSVLRDEKLAPRGAISILLDPLPPIPRLQFAGCHPLTLLLLVHYLYTDDVAAIWDFRVANPTEVAWRALGVNPLAIKQELLTLSQLLKLPRLSKALEGVLKMAAQPQLEADMRALHLRSCQPTSAPPGFHEPEGPDLVLQLANGVSVQCHSAILRVRSIFFATLFDDPDWTCSRRTIDGVITVDLSHLEWAPMEFVFRYVYCDEGQDMFNDVASAKSPSQLIELIFSVLAAANELLIDKLILICSRVIIQHASLQNACSLLRGARLFDAVPLIESLQLYIAVNMESMLQSNLLDDLRGEALRELSSFIRQQQTKKQPVTRSNELLIAATEKWGGWLSLQDIPEPFSTKRPPALPTMQTASPTAGHCWPFELAKMSSALIPHDDSVTVCSPTNDTTVVEEGDALSASELAEMLEPVKAVPPSKKLPISTSPSDVLPSVTPPVDNSPSPVWKGKGTSRSADHQDLRTIMESQKAITDASPTPNKRIVGFQVPGTPSSPDSPKWVPKLSLRERRKSQQSLQLTPTVDAAPSTSSPWKAVPKAAISIAESNIEARAAASQSAGSPPTGPSASSPSGLAKAMQAYTSPGACSEGTPAKEKPGAPGMGPMINPIRLSSYSGISVTTKKGGDAWTGTQPSQQRGKSATKQRIPEPAVSSDVFAENKKSLREIQEDERVAADFERWWAQEEARIKADEEATLATIAAITAAGAEISNPKKGKPRPKKKPNQNRRRPNDPSAEQSMPKPSTPSIPVPARSEAPGTRQARRK